MPHLLPDVDEALAFLRQRVSGELRSDSRQIAAGDGFLAWAGRKADGRAHVRRRWRAAPRLVWWTPRVPRRLSLPPIASPLCQT